MNGPKNPPAFPVDIRIDPSFYNEWNIGMTLRDWFAGQAVQGMIAEFAKAPGFPAWPRPHLIADQAFAIADAMLAARAATGVISTGEGA